MIGEEPRRRGQDGVPQCTLAQHLHLNWRRPWPAGEQAQEGPPGSEQGLREYRLTPAAAASCAYLMSRKAFILLHMLYAALARAHLEQGIQFGSPPFGRDIKRLETTNVEECRRWQGEGAQTACSAV